MEEVEEDLANQIRIFLDEDKKDSTELYLSKAEESQDLRIVSKFGGSPYQELNSTWPICSECNNKLDFICQLLLPGHLDLKHELAVMYYCFECNILEADNKSNKGWFLEFYKKVNRERFIPTASSEDSVTKECILKEIEGLSFPDVHYVYKNEKELWRALEEGVADPAEFFEDVVDNYIVESSFTFIGGYPQWIESEQTPKCDICNNEMALLFQIDSEEQADLIWGDHGVAYVFFCKDHMKEQKLLIQF